MDVGVVAGQLRGDAARPVERVEGLDTAAMQGPRAGNIDPIASGTRRLVALRVLHLARAGDGGGAVRACWQMMLVGLARGDGG